MADHQKVNQAAMTMVLLCGKFNLMKKVKPDGMVIAIDGPAGAGKSTVARRLARNLKMEYLDTGAMYRALTLRALNDHLDLDNEEDLARAAREMDMEMIYVPSRRPHYRMLVDGKDVTSKIRGREVSAHVSQVSSHMAVRREMVKKQRLVAERGNVVVEGRDVGTAVFPKADIKFFLTASIKERARRRYKEMKREGYNFSVKSIENEMVRRDHMDSTRTYNPLQRAQDAYLLDTTGMSVSQVVRRIIKLIKESPATREMQRL